MVVTAQDVADAYDSAPEGYVIRKGAGDALEAVEAQTSAFGTDTTVFAQKDGDGVWQSKTTAEMVTILGVGTGGGGTTLTGEEAIRVATAAAFATADRPRVNVLAQANAWHSDDEGWMLPLANVGGFVRRPIIAGHVPKHSLAAGGYVEISVIGEVFDTANFEIDVTLEGDVENTGAWAAALLFASGSLTEGIGLFDYRIRVYAAGRNKTILSGFGVREGPNIDSPYFCHHMAKKDSTPASGASIIINSPNNVSAGDKISFCDGQLGTNPSSYLYQFEFGTSTGSDETVAIGASNEDSLQNLATAIHESKLRLACELEDLTGGDWQLHFVTIMGGTHYQTSNTIGFPEVIIDTDGGPVMTGSDFTTVQADDGLIDWHEGQDLYVSARKSGAGGVNIYSASMIQYGTTRGWEPRV